MRLLLLALLASLVLCTTGAASSSLRRQGKWDLNVNAKSKVTNAVAKVKTTGGLASSGSVAVATPVGAVGATWGKCVVGCEAWCKEVAFPGAPDVSWSYQQDSGLSRKCKCVRGSFPERSCDSVGNGSRKYCCPSGCPALKCPALACSAAEQETIPDANGCNTCPKCKAGALQACPKLKCLPPPVACPTGSELQTPVDAAGCTGCAACLSKTTGQPVEVPPCLANKAACSIKPCLPGVKPVIKTPRGANGALPCCNHYTCMNEATGETTEEDTIKAEPEDSQTGKPACPALKCQPAPVRCPKVGGGGAFFYGCIALAVDLSAFCCCCCCCCCCCFLVVVWLEAASRLDLAVVELTYTLSPTLRLLHVLLLYSLPPSLPISLPPSLPS